MFVLLKNKKLCGLGVRRGGNEVLRVVYPVFETKNGAARHTAALIEALRAYGECVLADRALETLRAAVTGGGGFRRQRYEIGCAEEVLPEGYRLTVTAMLATGREILRVDKLEMYWDKSGEYQLPQPTIGSRKKRKSAKTV